MNEMKIKRRKTKIMIIILILAIASFFCIPAFSKGWKEDADGEWHYHDENDN